MIEAVEKIITRSITQESFISLYSKKIEHQKTFKLKFSPNEMIKINLSFDGSKRTSVKLHAIIAYNILQATGKTHCGGVNQGFMQVYQVISISLLDTRATDITIKADSIPDLNTAPKCHLTASRS